MLLCIIPTPKTKDPRDIGNVLKLYACKLLRFIMMTSKLFSYAFLSSQTNILLRNRYTYAV